MPDEDSSKFFVFLVSFILIKEVEDRRVNAIVCFEEIREMWEGMNVMMFIYRKVLNCCFGYEVLWDLLEKVKSAKFSNLPAQLFKVLIFEVLDTVTL